MEALLGFHVGFWDYATFVAIFVIVLAGLGVAVFVLGLPGRIAIARNHPEADAVNLMGRVGFVAIVPWRRASRLQVLVPRSAKRLARPIWCMRAKQIAPATSLLVTKPSQRYNARWVPGRDLDAWRFRTNVIADRRRH